MNENWRIDQQGTSSNGPNGKSQPGVTWANLQLQYGGTGERKRRWGSSLDVPRWEKWINMAIKHLIKHL